MVADQGADLSPHIDRTPRRVLHLLISSPADATVERATVVDAVSDWNASHSASYDVVFEERRWERDSLPSAGRPPQDLINQQLVDTSDAVIAVFRFRLGSPTSKAPSGTVEEIERCSAAGKPAVVYFSNAPVPQNELDHFERLRAFRSDFRERALYAGYESVDDLRRHVDRDLTKLVKNLIRGEHLQERISPRSWPTLVQARDTYLANCPSQYSASQYTASQRTIRNYRTLINRFLQFASDHGVPPGSPVTALTRDLLAEYSDHLRQSHVPASHRNYMEIVRVWVNRWSVIPDHLQFNWSSLVPPTPPLRAADPGLTELFKRGVDFDVRDVIRLRDRALILLLHDTGAHVSELLALNRSSVNMQMRCVIIQGRKKRLVMQLSAESVTAIQEYLTERSDSLAALFIQHRRWAATRQKQASLVRLSARSVQLVVREFGRRHGIRVTPESFRRERRARLLGGFEFANAEVVHVHTESGMPWEVH